MERHSAWEGLQKESLVSSSITALRVLQRVQGSHCSPRDHQPVAPVTASGHGYLLIHVPWALRVHKTLGERRRASELLSTSKDGEGEGRV